LYVFFLTAGPGDPRRQHFAKQNALFVPAMSQLMERAQIFFGEPHPSISVYGRP
jgi:hypothetical protein